MENTFRIPTLLLASGIYMITGIELCAQGKGHGNGNGNGKSKHQQEYKVANPELVYHDSEGRPDKAYKGNGKGKAKKEYKSKGRTFAHSTPHKLNIPPGHYPPTGMYRIWYPGRPPGHQPQAIPYGSPPNAPITDGAFILHSGRAYDTQYDWRKEEAQKPRSVPRQIIDVLFPNNTLPAQ